MIALHSPSLRPRPDEEGIETFVFAITNLLLRHCLRPRPDEEGIETSHVDSSGSVSASLRPRPDEEGIETCSRDRKRLSNFRRTQFNSSLIESWQPDTEQSQAWSGFEP